MRRTQARWSVSWNPLVPAKAGTQITNREQAALDSRLRGNERKRRVGRVSLLDRHRLGHLDTFAADPAAIGDGLDPYGSRRVEGRAIGGVDVAGELEAPRRPDLDQRAGTPDSCGQGWTFSGEKIP